VEFGRARGPVRTGKLMNDKRGTTTASEKPALLPKTVGNHCPAVGFCIFRDGTSRLGFSHFALSHYVSIKLQKVLLHPGLGKPRAPNRNNSLRIDFPGWPELNLD
jgi:hypothetical protein